MSEIPEFYIAERREFKVNEAWFAPAIALSYFGSAGTVTAPTAKVVRLSDGEDVTSTFWPGGIGAVNATEVSWSPFTMAAAGNYEIELSAQVNGRVKTYVVAIKVF